MEDEEIVFLFLHRKENAIQEVQSKYHNYCYSIANHMLRSPEDSKEVLNDAYMAAWNTIPPNQPENLATYLGKIVRRLSLKKLRYEHAEKRGSSDAVVAFHELENCISVGQLVEDQIEVHRITDIINAFLECLPLEERQVFLCRYWYYDSISEISQRFHFSQSKVKMMLKRTRDRLSRQLKKEDVIL